MEQLTEGKIIKYKLMTYGYEKGRMSMELSNDIIMLGKNLAKLNLEPSTMDIRCEKNDVLPLTKEFFDKNFRLHDIAYLTEAKAREVIKNYSKNNIILPDQLSEFCESLNKEATMITPYDLPIVYHPGHSMIGSIKKSIFTVPDNDFSKKQQISFEEIILGNEITKLTPATYAHEIVHSQIESIKGSTRHYHNSEILPILIEKIVALELDPNKKLLKKSELTRWKDVLIHIVSLWHASIKTRTELLEDSVYVTSTLKAENLFDQYLYGDSKIKEEMLSQIQSIFDGKETVESFLEKYDVTLENSTDIEMIKRHLY